MIKTKQELLNHFSDINAMYNNPFMYQTLNNMIDELLEQQPCKDMGEVSDGYHTFNQLYHQRAVLFATIVNQNKDKSWKSFKHSDGNYCFDSNGKWFIVGIDTPQGSYTYHYAKEYWDMFDCQELECGKEWDGHTEEDVNRLLSLKQQPCEDAISREDAINALKGALYNYEDKTEKQFRESKELNFEDWFQHRIFVQNMNDIDIQTILNLPSVTPSYNSIKSELEPCEDCISREGTINAIQDKYYDNAIGIDIVDIVAHLPSATPKTENEKYEDKRACENCIHYVTRDSRGVVLCGCDSWECDFEEVKT